MCAYYSLILMCLNIGTPNNHHFPIGTNGKVVVLGVPILKHFRVSLLPPLIWSSGMKTVNLELIEYFFLHLLKHLMDR